MIFSDFSRIQAVGKCSMADWILKVGCSKASRPKSLLPRSLWNCREWVPPSCNLGCTCHLLCMITCSRKEVMFRGWAASPPRLLEHPFFQWELRCCEKVQAATLRTGKATSPVDSPRWTPSRQPSAAAKHWVRTFWNLQPLPATSSVQLCKDPSGDHMEIQGCTAGPCLSSWAQNQEQTKCLFFFPLQLYWGIIDTQHCVNVRCTMCWFDSVNISIWLPPFKPVNLEVISYAAKDK